MDQFPPRSAASKPRAGAAAASRKETLHTAGVVSRVLCDFVLPRQTRWTETLTGQAIHTSSNATKHSGSKWNKDRA